MNNENDECLVSGSTCTIQMRQWVDTIVPLDWTVMSEWSIQEYHWTNTNTEFVLFAFYSFSLYFFFYISPFGWCSSETITHFNWTRQTRPNNLDCICLACSCLCVCVCGSVRPCSYSLIFLSLVIRELWCCLIFLSLCFACIHVFMLVCLHYAMDSLISPTHMNCSLSTHTRIYSRNVLKCFDGCPLPLSNGSHFDIFVY